jgi:hypothetical protein
VIVFLAVLVIGALTNPEPMVDGVASADAHYKLPIPWRCVDHSGASSLQSSVQGSLAPTQ